MYDLLEKSGALSCSIVTGGDNTLLHWFCYKKENDKQINLLNKLIDKGCDVNAQNWEQRTPLMIAAKNDMINTCRILLKNNGDSNKCDSKGHQAIDLSVPGSECSKLLLQYVQSNSLNKTNQKVLWRKRIDPTHRSTSQLNNIHNYDDNSQSNSSRSSVNEEELCDESSHQYIQRPNSAGGFPKKYQHNWGKFFPINSKERITKTLFKRQTESADLSGRIST